MPSKVFSASRLLLLGILLFGPLAFGAVQAWAWGLIALATAIVLFLWATGSIGQRYVALAWCWLFVPLGLLFSWGLVQLNAHVSVDPASTREALLKLAAFVLLFFLTAQLFQGAPASAWEHLGLLVVLFAALLAIYAILQAYSNPGLIYWIVKSRNKDLRGPYVNRDHYAGLMEMLIPIAACYCFSKKRSMALSLCFGVVIAIVSLLLTGSRGGLVALMTELILLAVIIVTCVKGIEKASLAWATGAAIVAAVGVFFVLAPRGVPARLASILRVNDPGVVPYRREVYADTLRIFRDHLAAGTGLGTFEAIYPQYQSFPSDFNWDHAHNDYAEYLAEAGLPGAVLLLAALPIFFYKTFWSGLRERLQTTAGWIQVGATLSCCGLLVHSFFDFNLHIPANASWFSVCAALACVDRRVRETTNLQ
ncbi:MAG: O-antigen ligase family protein [Acidobacteriaceae bacterium]|nr:O-antigen ligase family protein [Acidobacteriaceae bacterium]